MRRAVAEGAGVRGPRFFPSAMERMLAAGKLSQKKGIKCAYLQAGRQAGTLSTVGKLVLPSRCSVSVVIGIIIVVVVVAESIL